MPDTRIQAAIPLTPDEAFEIYVGKMDVWWPRQGVFPYSFAPKTTFPRHIRFEPKLGGRYYETFADDSEYTIGHITLWGPPTALSYTWRGPDWPGETAIQLNFAPVEQGTDITHEQDGFAAAGVPSLIPYYQIGSRQTLAAYIAHCRAVYELRQKGLHFGQPLQSSKPSIRSMM